MASLSDVVKGIQSTNELLVENVKGQNRTAAMITAFVTGQQSSFGDRLEAGREKGKSTKATAQPVKGSGGGGFKSGVMKGSGLSSLLGFGSKIIGALFSGVAAAGLLTAITVAAGTAFGGLIAGGAVVGLIKLFGEGVLNKIFDIIDPNNVKFTETQKMSITQSILRNLMAGALLLFIAPKLGLAVFLGLLLKDLALSMFDKKTRDKLKEKILKGEFENKFMQAFADNFTLENMATVGGIIASFFGLGLLTGAIRQAFTGSPKGGPSGAKVKPRFGGLFRKAFGARLGLALMLPALGTAIGSQIESLTGDKDLAKIASVGINATIIAGMIGGPYAALIAAIATLSIMAFNKMREWVFGQQEDQLNRLAKEREIAKMALELDPNNTMLARNLETANIAYANDLQRTSQLGGGRANALLNAQRIKDREELTGLSLSNKDFYSERAGTFYTGIGDSDLSPYTMGTLKFRKFAEAATAALRDRMQGRNVGKQLQDDYESASSAFSPGLNIARTKSLSRRLDRELAERQQLKAAAEALAIAAQAALARENSLSTPGNTTVVVAGNQRVSTIDATTGAYAPRNYSNPYIQYGVQTTSAGGGF